jgi:hypothetical protein
VSAPRGDDGKQTAEADVVQMLAGLPGQVSKAAAQRLVPLVLAALGEGWTLVALRAHLARLCDPERVRYAPAVYEKHLRELPAPPASTGLRGAAADMCEQHPVFPAGDCTPCRLAQMKARRGDVDGGSGPLPLDVTAVLDRVRAGLGAGGGQR